MVLYCITVMHYRSVVRKIWQPGEAYMVLYCITVIHYRYCCKEDMATRENIYGTVLYYSNVLQVLLQGRYGNQGKHIWYCTVLQ